MRPETQIPPGRSRGDRVRRRRLLLCDDVRQRADHADAGQVGAESHLEGGPTVELKVVQEGRRRRVRVTSPGYRPDLNVAFPRHLRKPGATFVIPAAALTVTQRGHYSVKPTALVRTSHGGGGGGTGGEHKILGKVPLTIYYKVIRRGVAFLLAVGSHWPIDYVLNSVLRARFVPQTNERVCTFLRRCLGAFEEYEQLSNVDMQLDRPVILVTGEMLRNFVFRTLHPELAGAA